MFKQKPIQFSKYWKYHVHDLRLGFSQGPKLLSWQQQWECMSGHAGKRSSWNNSLLFLPPDLECFLCILSWFLFFPTTVSCAAPEVFMVLNSAAYSFVNPHPPRPHSNKAYAHRLCLVIRPEKPDVLRLCIHKHLETFEKQTFLWESERLTVFSGLFTYPHLSSHMSQTGNRNCNS